MKEGTMRHANERPSTPRRRSLIRAAVAGTGVAAVLSFAGPAFAAGNGNFTPPPGCTGSWNTIQAANNNHAPGTAPGCTVAESHVS
jgi:hypothetical protein